MHPYITEALVAEHQRQLRDEAARDRLAAALAPSWRSRAGATLIRLGTLLQREPRPRARVA
ncbi:hypothetical protein [Spirilliplanes yamanashiensis]|uniref:Uncharacterized protein n=1 Tax=Spirilliplanes yamanashiensis TaxID=42233 RepID=A0A8J3Y574_9ACTN|nr:hypothetical protein [Spirilliplanes yamanashiensis]MDP9819479.1 hypothetical protein [Spirilliplanes yamanashiensis]GIJ01699.1 hypothetical protein Sya03_10510 [Spirilliplanes yamanashiensis]